MAPPYVVKPFPNLARAEGAPRPTPARQGCDLDSFNVLWIYLGVPIVLLVLVILGQALWILHLKKRVYRETCPRRLRIQHQVPVSSWDPGSPVLGTHVQDGDVEMHPIEHHERDDKPRNHDVEPGTALGSHPVTFRHTVEEQVIQRCESPVAVDEELYDATPPPRRSVAAVSPNLVAAPSPSPPSPRTSLDNTLRDTGFASTLISKASLEYLSPRGADDVDDKDEMVISPGSDSFKKTATTAPTLTATKLDETSDMDFS